MNITYFQLSLEKQLKGGPFFPITHNLTFENSYFSHFLISLSISPKYLTIKKSIFSKFLDQVIKQSKINNERSIYLCSSFKDIQTPEKGSVFNIKNSTLTVADIKELNNLQCAVMITTDKVYDNKEWVWGYRENDSLGGHDPYSASKACAEIAIKSYKKSFFQDLNIVSARAGNVIGGGDFADNRIIPDIVRAIEKNTYVELRNPHSVRPWQHVLDVLYGYILLAYSMINNKNISESYNFAPIDEGDKFTVEYITKAFIDNIGKGSYIINSSETSKKEMNMLRLDSSLARKELNWKEKFNTEEAIKQTAIWYKEYLNKNNINNITEIQIKKIIEEG